MKPVTRATIYLANEEKMYEEIDHIKEQYKNGEFDLEEMKKKIRFCIADAIEIGLEVIEEEEKVEEDRGSRSSKIGGLLRRVLFFKK